MDKIAEFSSELLIISSGEHAGLVSEIGTFLEQHDFQCVIPDKNELNDVWSIRKKLAQFSRVLLFVSDGFPEDLLPQLKSTPAHLLSIFPVVTDCNIIPDCISSNQAFLLEKDGSNFEKLKSGLLNWLNADIFQEEQKNINLRLSPLSFAGRLEMLQNIPRPDEMNDILERIKNWDNRNSSKIFIIEGGAASGKSHVSAQLLLEQGNKVIAAHFINDCATPEQIIKNLAAQLAANLAQFRQTLAGEIRKNLDSLDASSLFNVLILTPLRRENPNQHYYLLLDGIENLNNHHHRNPLAEILIEDANQLPDWLNIIITARPDSGIRELIGRTAEFYTLPEHSAPGGSFRFTDAPVVSGSVADDEKNAISSEESAERLPVFISYGHDIHTDKVVAIREELVRRGHKVWIDKYGIPAGSDWRRKIYDGIRHSRLFLAFLSEHSVKSEFCQTEIRIAVGAPEHLMPSLPVQLEDARVPDQLSYLKRVDLRNWPSVADNTAFTHAVNSLVEWIDDDRHRTFCKEMEELNHLLEPFSFEARLGELLNSPFLGREWLLEIIDRWDNSPSQLFGLVAGPGFGKSIFAANLRALQPQKVVAAQFIEWNMPSLFTAGRIIRSLAFQLAMRLETYRTALLDVLHGINNLDALEENELFEKLLTLPLENVSSQENRWIILDALDEANDRNGSNPFVSTLVRNLDQLPSWLKVVVTTRPDCNILKLLEPYHLERFDSENISGGQRTDMLEYLCYELKTLVPHVETSGVKAVAAALSQTGFTGKVLDQLIDKSQNMFLYLRIVCRDIVTRGLTAQDIQELPSGIESIFARYFNRQYRGEQLAFFREKLRPLLEIGSACCGDITVELLQASAAANGLVLSCAEVADSLATLGALAEIFDDNGRRIFRFIHKFIWEWLLALPENSLYRIDGFNGHKMLAEFSLGKIYAADGNDSNLAYALRYAVSHLIALNDSARLWKILGGESPGFFEKQKKYLGDYVSSLEDCAQAIAFFGKTSVSPLIEKLPEICRLMITYRSLLEKQKGALMELPEHGYDLKYALKVMNCVDDAKVYYLIGCRLLAHAAKQGKDVEPLIATMEQKCRGKLSAVAASISDEGDWAFSPSDLPELYGQEYYYGFRNSRVIPYDIAAVSYIDFIDHHNRKNYDSVLSVHDCLFLGYGPLSEALPFLSVNVLERVLEIIEEEQARELILDAMSARSTSANTMGAMLHFENLHHYTGLEFAPPDTGEDWDLEDEAYSDFINSLLVHDICSSEGFSAQNCLDEICDLTDDPSEDHDPFFIFRTTGLLHQSGARDKAVNFLLAHSKSCEKTPAAFAAELCKYGEYEKALSLFERHFFLPAESSRSIIRNGVSVFKRLSVMSEAGMWENVGKIIRTSSQIFRKLTMPEAESLLTDLMKEKQYALAAEISRLVFPGGISEGKNYENWCLKSLEAPNLVRIFRQLCDAGESPLFLRKLAVGKRQELLSENRCNPWFLSLKSSHQTDEILSRIFGETDLESIADKVLRTGVSPEIQLTYIDRLFSLFEQRADGLKKEELTEQIGEILCILGKNSGELREKLRPYTKELIQRYVSRLDTKSIAELEFFKPAVSGRGPFENMLLFDSTDEDFLNKCIRHLGAYTHNRVYCLIIREKIPEIKALFENASMTDKDKGSMLFDGVEKLLAYHCSMKKEDPGYLWQVPESLIEVIRLGRESGGRFSSEIPRMLYQFREQENARRAAAVLMEMKSEACQKYSGVKLFAEAFLCDYSWLISWEQYCEKAGELATGYKYGTLKTLLSRLEQCGNLPDDWFSESLAMLNDSRCLPDITLAGNGDDTDFLLGRLLDFTVTRGTCEQVEKLLSFSSGGIPVFSANMLVECSRRMTFREPVKLCGALLRLEWGRHTVYRILAVQAWRSLPFADLCAISPCMLNDNAFLNTWLNGMLESLCTMPPQVVHTVIEYCPELDFSDEEQNKGGKIL